MTEGKKTEITCGGCGKKIPVTTGEGHTGIAKCDCGTTTSVKGEPGPVLEQLNQLVNQVPAVLEKFKASRRKGFETGIDEALHESSRELAAEILKEDPDLREALKRHVRGALEDGLLGKEEEGPELPQR